MKIGDIVYHKKLNELARSHDSKYEIYDDRNSSIKIHNNFDKFVIILITTIPESRNWNDIMPSRKLITCTPFNNKNYVIQFNLDAPYCHNNLSSKEIEILNK